MCLPSNITAVAANSFFFKKELYKMNDFILKAEFNFLFLLLNVTS